MLRQESADPPQMVMRQSGGTIRIQPTARQFGWSNQLDVGPAQAKEVDEPYRELLGFQRRDPASRLSDGDER
jgi:hypothetical protein